MRNRMLSLLAGALLAAGWMGTAQASVIGDPNATVSGGTLTVTSTATGGYTNLLTLNDSNDTGSGAVSFRLANSVSSFQLNAYGSGAPGTLKGSSGLFGFGNRVLFGGGAGTPVLFFANGDYSNPNGHLYIATTGKIGIGTSNPTSQLHVATGQTGYTQVIRGQGTVDPGVGATQMLISNPQSSVALSAYGSGAPGVLANASAIIGTANKMLIGGGPSTPLVFFANNAYSGAGHLTIATSGNVGIGTATPATLLDVNGEASVNVINIRGGSDFSEQFNIQDGTGKAEPGMVVCIDPQHAGELVVSNKAYDRTVAGIISGAGGVKPGMVMGQQDHALMYGKYPVALTGRVYCMADASNGAIQPGDLLTTSDKPGHAMKVADFDRAHGTIIGKAMTGLDKGQGLVLVLVGLQ